MEIMMKQCWVYFLGHTVEQYEAAAILGPSQQTLAMSPLVG